METKPRRPSGPHPTDAQPETPESVSTQPPPHPPRWKTKDPRVGGMRRGQKAWSVRGAQLIGDSRTRSPTPRPAALSQRQTGSNPFWEVWLHPRNKKAPVLTPAPPHPHGPTVLSQLGDPPEPREPRASGRHRGPQRGPESELAPARRPGGQGKARGRPCVRSFLFFQRKGGVQRTQCHRPPNWAPRPVSGLL